MLENMLDLEKIEGLMKLMEQSSLKTVSIEDEGFKIKMSKLDNAPILAQGSLAPAAAAITPAAAPAAPAEDETEVNITSPIVGTFYSASGPTIPAYVKVGDTVRSGDTICIIEAMKMMNEITAEFDCRIESVLVSNEQKVEYGQPLFRVRKL
jgi:acetyl-CoA carboxylase biotin carboxyl carrier protein